MLSPVFELAKVSVFVEASRLTLFGEELQRSLLSSRWTEMCQRAIRMRVIRINLRGSKKRKRPGDGSRVGAGEELGGVGALVAARPLV